MNDTSVSIPDPTHISFPWNESNISLMASNRNCVQENLSINKAMSEMTITSNVACLESKPQSTSPILRIENSNFKNLETDKIWQCETEEPRSHNPDCSGDHQRSRSMQVLYRSPEFRRHEVPDCKSALFYDNCVNCRLSRHVHGTVDVNRSFDDQTPETVAESPVPVRIPSPSSASSVTSGKRLEWDSGADVGYQFVQDHNLHSGVSLSTIERIALAHGRSSGLFERLDPEGFCGPPKPVLVSQLSCELDSPVAKSTPIYRSENKTSSGSAEKGPVAPTVESPETVLPGGVLYLHSGKEFGNEMAPLHRNGSESQNEDSCDEDRIPTSDKLNKKHSNSLVNLNFSSEEVQSCVPRSKSYLNLLDKNEDILVEKAVQSSRVLTGTCSVSSSSVATIVQKPIFPKTSDKFIQTLPLKLSVGVQVSESMEHSHLPHKISEVSGKTYSSVPTVDETKNQKGTLNKNSNMSHNHKCNGAHRKGSAEYNCQNYLFQSSNSSVNNSNNNNINNKNNGEKYSEKVQVKEKENLQTEDFHASEKGTLDSAGSSSRTVESCAAETSCSGVGRPRGDPSGSPGVADSTNSFEYLPGHVFDKASKYPSDASNQSAASETSANKVPLKSHVSMEINGRSDSRSSALSKDIEEGVELLQKLMSEKSYNGKTKKKLIRLIVNKLVNTDYPEDHDMKQFKTVPLSCNVPWVPAAPSAPHLLETLSSCPYFVTGERNNKSRKFVQSSNTLSSSERGKDRTIDSEVTSEIHSSPSSCTPSGSLSVPGDNEQSQGETSEISSNIYGSSKKDWKRPTSRTEEEHETSRLKSVKNSSPTSSLLHLCKSEHEKQLQWIRFEIDHLSQLKQLLEKQEVTKSHSNLAEHEHKFHKIKSAKNCLYNSEFQRSKTKGSDSWNNGMVNYVSSQGNSSLKTSCSSSLSYQEQLLPHSCHHSLVPNGSNLSHQTQERCTKKLDSKKNLSTQTLSLDSYIIHNGSTNSGLKDTNSDDAQLNVYVQTSPKMLRRPEDVQHEFPTVAKVSQCAKRSYESAVKCCCDCRKALEDLMMQKDGNVHTFCRCKSASSESDHLATDVSYSSFGHSDITSTSNTPETNDTVSKHLPQKRDIATETIVNNAVQTTPSLNDLPIIKPLWSCETSRDLSQKVKEKLCPCCGLREKPFGADKKPKKRTDFKSKHSFVNERGKHHTICDAAVQTINKDPLAYLLTFEPTCKENISSKNNDMLPEIKLFVPVSQNKLEKEMKRKTSDLGTCKENQCPLDTIENNQQNSKTLNQLPKEENEKKTHKLSLQEYLQTNRPDYIQHADKRSQCLADLALLRDLRKQKRLELMAMTDVTQNEKLKEELSNERIVFSCASVPSKPKLSSRQIREQSHRKYQKSWEVQNKFVEKKKKEDFKTNRLMAELFTKKLQKKVLQGKVNHSYSASIISSVP